MKHVKPTGIGGDLEAQSQPGTEEMPTSIPSTPSPTKVDDVASDVETLDNNGDGPYAKHYRPDARIWRLYLEEAGAEDKELITIWESGLDSLLLFAGLFAGILTAFILQSSQELQEDPQEHLLKEILYSIRNDSIVYAPQPFYPTTLSLCINFLWFVSFTLTLISALGGVLAKGWVAKYTPTSRTERCQDACDRHLRYVRARQWHLGGIITGLPILIQLALLLFLLGLVLFTHDGNLGIGFTILVLIVFTLLLYVTSTILPIFSPAAPLHTPISDLISSAAEKGRTHGRPRDAKVIPRWQSIVSFLKNVQGQPTQIQIKANILAWIFANSKDDKTLKEAVKAMAGTTRYSAGALRDAFQKNGADEYFCQKFVHCFESTPSNVCLREAYLYALLRVVQPTDTSLDNSRFAALLNPKQPLHRWDGSSERCLWALAFSVRTHIRANQDKDDDYDDETWQQTRDNLVSIAKAGSTPYVRKILAEAAMRGLAGKMMNLKRLCGLVLSRRLNMADVRKIIRTPQAAGSKGTDPAIVQVNVDVLKDVLENLVILLNDDDHVIRNSVSQGLITLTGHLEFHDAIAASIPTIVAQLKSMKYQSNVVHTLSKLAERVEFRNAVTDNIFTLLTWLESSGCDWRIQAAAADVLSTTIANHVEFRARIVPCIPMLVNLLDSPCHDAAARALSELAEHVEFRASIADNMPTFVKLLESSKVRDAVLGILTELAEHTEFRLPIAEIIPKIVALVGIPHRKVINPAARTLSKLAAHSECRLPIANNIYKLMEMLSTDGVQHAAVQALCQLAERVIQSLKEEKSEGKGCGTAIKLHNAIAANVPALLNPLESSDWKYQAAAARILLTLADHAEFHAAIAPYIPTLVKLLESDSTHSNVRWLASGSLSKLADHADSRATIVARIPMLLRALGFHAQDPVSQDGAARALLKLAKYPHSCAAIAPGIPMFLKLLESFHQRTTWRVIAGERIDVEETAALALLALAEHADSREKIVAGIPKLLTLLESTHSDVQARALSKLSEHPGLREAISPCIPNLFRWLESTTWRPLQVAAADALSKLVDHAEFCPTIAKNIPTLVKLMESTDSNIQAAAAKILRKLGGVSEVDIDKSVAPVRLEIGDALGHCLDMGDIIGDHPTLTERPKGDRGITSPVSQESRVSTALTLSQTHPINTATHSLQSLCTFTRGVFQIMSPLFPPVMNLVDLLESPAWKVRDAASDTLSKLADHADCRATIASNIPKLVKLLQSSKLSVQDASSRTLSKLAGHVKLQIAIAAEISTLVTLLENANADVLVVVSDILAQLADHVKLRPIISHSVPTLVKLLESADFSVRYCASKTLSKLSDHVELRAEITTGIPVLVTWLDTTNPDDHVAAACVLSKLVDEVESCSAIPRCIGMLVTLLGSCRHGQLEDSAVHALSEFAMHAKFCPAIAPSIPTLVMLLKSNDASSGAQVAACDTLSNLADHGESKLAISFLIPTLSAQLESSDRDVQVAVTAALSKLANHAELCTIIASDMSNLVKLLDSTREQVRISMSETLSKLVMHDELHPVIAPTIPTLVKLLDSTYWEVQVTAGCALSKLADHIKHYAAIDSGTCILLNLLYATIPTIRHASSVSLSSPSERVELRKAIASDIPALLELLKSKYSYFRTAAALAFSEIADYVELHAAIDPCIPIFANLLHYSDYNSNWRVQVAASETLSKLAFHAKSRSKFACWIPEFVSQLESSHWEVRAAAGRALSKFALHADLRAIIHVIFSTLERMSSPNPDVQVAIGYTLSQLAHHTEFQAAMTHTIPTLVKLLGSHSDAAPFATDALLQVAERDNFVLVVGEGSVFTVLSSSRDNLNSTELDMTKCSHDDSSVSQSLLNGLSHYNDNNVRCSIKVFCHFYLHGHLQDLLLDVILLALTSLKAQDHNIQRSGITILAGLAEHSIFIPSICTVASIVEFFENFMQDIPHNIVKHLLEQMVSFGCLESF